MPHLTLEYTDNLEFDVQPLLARLHDELVATGAVNLKGIKSRAIRLSDYRMADGYPGYAFVHVDLLIRAGANVKAKNDYGSTPLSEAPILPKPWLSLPPSPAPPPLSGVSLQHALRKATA